ncbi:MAG: M15 family metallopeptidase, partial [Oscillospiraceae bacterium]|nr:M15 family metallopeptidase [Oscillospiraceae bacterium]
TAAETTEAPTEDTTAATEYPTEDTTEDPTGETDTAEAAVPVNASPSGNIAANVQQLYVRINHTQRIVLRLSGGLKQSDIRWSTDNPDVIDLVAGEVTGLQKGTCTVTASYGSDAVQIPVTVRELTVEKGITCVDGLLVVNKSYSLPSDYDPGLLPITEEAFNALAEDAASEGYDIYIGSPYRSYQFQEKVYNSMVSGYGKEYADALSARPGHSEHQSGYTIDCNTIDNNFADTPAGQWLAEHAHEYGFIIRYPKGKENITGYAYESWHIRYVGIEHATNMYRQGLTLEEYLDVQSVYDDTEEDVPVVDNPDEENVPDAVYAPEE